MKTPTYQSGQEENGSTAAVLDAPASLRPADHSKASDPVEKMIGQYRYALLLRNQVACKLNEAQFQSALDAFQRGMALVPEGDVVVEGPPRFVVDDPDYLAVEDEPEEYPFHIEPFFMDRYPVTNRQYFEFVSGGGYRDMALWDRRIWPAVLDMVDQTGEPGPRFWKNGCYLPGQEELPVVGISWYEASACACWMCKRLPTDAEWVKAASWPISIDEKTLLHRRYPWGDAMDLKRANVWGAGPDRIVPVQEFAEGVNVGGIYQLIGNVWEWTDGEFRGHSNDGFLELPTPMKIIRGGAFDTYFENQANAQFTSGENPLGRRHNVGFRCAIGMSEIELRWPNSNAATDGDDNTGEKSMEVLT